MSDALTCCYDANMPLFQAMWDVLEKSPGANRKGYGTPAGASKCLLLVLRRLQSEISVLPLWPHIEDAVLKKLLNDCDRYIQRAEQFVTVYLNEDISSADTDSNGGDGSTPTPASASTSSTTTSSRGRTVHRKSVVTQTASLYDLNNMLLEAEGLPNVVVGPYVEPLRRSFQNAHQLSERVADFLDNVVPYARSRRGK